MFIIILPWHLIMLKLHDPLFFQEYIIKHHIQRFLGSETINRARPFYFYFVVLLWGFFPHIFVFLSKIVAKLKTKDFFVIKLPITDFDRFIKLNIIAALVTFVFFTSSGTKLITYILPIYPFLAAITAGIWYRQNDKVLKISSGIIDILFSIALIGIIFCGFFLPADLYSRLQSIQILLLITFPIFLGTNIYSIIKNNKQLNFFSLVFLMAVLTAFATPMVYKLDYSFGESDLIKYA